MIFACQGLSVLMENNNGLPNTEPVSSWMAQWALSDQSSFSTACLTF